MIDLITLLKRSEARIMTLHPSLQVKAFEFIKRCYRENIFVLVYMGLRSVDEQNRLYAMGRTAPGKIVTQVRGGWSYHNFGCAFDVAPYTDGSARVIDWKVGPKWLKMGEIGRTLDLDWGGDWTSFKDYPHYQVKRFTIDQLRAGIRPNTPVIEGDEYEMSVDDANKIIAFLQAAWHVAKTKDDKYEFHRLANELRKASGQLK